MKYINTTEAVFINRPNRFIANVDIGGRIETVHVRNTGRCREILVPGTRVILEKSQNTNRKTGYTLVSAYKGSMLINIDSLAPNAVVYEGIKNGKIHGFPGLHSLRREVFYGSSRFDIYFETQDEKGFVEVKGATLEGDGIVKFPDAPTERGTKHVNEMKKAVQEGYGGYIFFLIQMKGIKYFTPNAAMDSDFSSAVKNASRCGVRILAYDSIVTEDEITIGSEVKVVI